MKRSIFYTIFILHNIFILNCWCQSKIPFEIYINDKKLDAVMEFSYENQFSAQLILRNVFENEDNDDIYLLKVVSSNVPEEFISFYGKVQPINKRNAIIEIQLHYLYPQISEIDFAAVSWLPISLWIQNESQEIIYPLAHKLSVAMNTNAFYDLCTFLPKNDFSKIENHILAHVFRLSLVQRFSSSNNLLMQCYLQQDIANEKIKLLSFLTGSSPELSFDEIQLNIKKYNELKDLLILLKKEFPTNALIALFAEE